ncbi:MAG: menaquinone biosynthetic enzyme MqnA/MqnD family protein [Bacteroidales bacterium]
MSKVNVSAVSYLNSLPFVYGLRHSDIFQKINLSLDYPAECARKVFSGEADVGLVPAITLFKRNDYSIISDYCIGATSSVGSVMLLSNEPIDGLKTIHLDYQSRTSAALIQILAKYYWKINVEWKLFSPTNLFQNISQNEGVLAIGDKVFENQQKFSHRIDLATEWLNFTGLPMVFALWLSGKELNADFLTTFNKALDFGLNNIPTVINEYDESILSKEELEKYFKQNISYNFDEQKRRGLSKFFEYASMLNNL